MKSLYDILNEKVNQINNEKIDKGNKRKRINSFIKNAFAVIELISEREKKRSDIQFHYISRDKFKGAIARNECRAEVMNFLKENNIIDVLKKDGKEYYIHFEHEEMGYNKQPKGYKITEYGHKILSDAVNDNQFKYLIKEYKITKKEIKKFSPQEVMTKYGKEEYYLKSRSRENVEKVLKNNLELEFHPLSDEEMINIYKIEKRDLGDQDIKMLLQMVKDYFANKEFTYNVRLYSAFTNTPKCWRKFVTNSNGIVIDELFDIHSSVMNILPLVCRIVFASGKIDQNKFSSFLDEEKKLDSILESKDVDIYNLIGEGKFERQAVKEKLMHVIFSNNQSISKIEYTKRGKVVKSVTNQIKYWLKNNVPTMYEVLCNFEQVKDGNKMKSMFWYYFQKLETELMVNLNGMMSNKFNTTIYNIHDGIFCDKNVITKERKEICKKYYNVIKKKLAEEISKGKVSYIYKNERNVDDMYYEFKESTKDNIIDWLKATGTKQDLIDVENERYYDLYKIAYNYNAGRIKSTRDM